MRAAFSVGQFGKIATFISSTRFIEICPVFARTGGSDNQSRSFEPAAKLCYSYFVNDNVAIPSSSSNSPGMLNRLGLVVLVAGLVSAGVVYWAGQNRSAQQQATPTADGEWRDGTFSTEDSKIATRNVELYGGPVEMLMVKFEDALKRPEWQAILIATTSILIALACFLAAHRLSSVYQGVIENR
jgi:hypothetical protein